jgi:flagellar basal body-associated protein FliL
MLAKIPTQQKPKTKKSTIKTEFVLLLVIILTGLGLAAGYMMLPLLQTPLSLNQNTNISNNTTSYAPITNASTITSNNNLTSKKLVKNVTIQNTTKNNTTKTNIKVKNSLITNKTNY